MNFKVEFISWDTNADEIAAQVTTALEGFQTRSGRAYTTRVVTRTWSQDANFTEVGIYTDRRSVAEHLAKRFAGQAYFTKSSQS